MKVLERTILILIVVVLIGGAYGIYYAVHENRAEVRSAVDAGEYERPVANANTVGEAVETEDWRTYFPFTVPILIGDTVVQASIADTLSQRIKGLSGTPYLPEGVVKLFAFGVSGEHSIWMKDMNYALDILWADEDGKIVHIEENVSPDTFPTSFASPVPAWYVVEANAGFVASNTIAVGTQIVLPQPTD